ncbi:hypothetical protein SGCZBJ_09860 [Caulobacter zeae]|uniref:Uncharacterized protein n=2 Tax=Caulobacter zeae TaxID=2055137 RepID=A0A2N5DKP4_9CAUL|nr:hypothetical protein SGCZBJ_09860 [Caulobacter zeae]
MTMRRRPASPSIVYKYYGPERADVFRSFRVRFSQLGALNDPFEFLVQARPGELRRGAQRMAGRMSNPFSLIGMGVWAAFKGVRENGQLKTLAWPVRMIALAVVLPLAILMTLLLGPFIAKTMRKVMAAAADEFEVLLLEQVRRGLVLVFSCSEAWASVPMWAHYAGNHTGFTIGLDPASAFPNPNPKSDKRFLPALKVKYVRRQPRISMSDMDTSNFLTAKMDHWAYEKEWRFLNMPDGAAQRGVVVNGHELLLFNFRPDAIREVVLGANCAAETVATILDAIAEADLKLDLFQVKRSAGYGFERIRIRSLEDLQVETSPGGIVRDLREMKFERMEAAFDDFQKDASEDRIARWLRNVSERS